MSTYPQPGFQPASLDPPTSSAAKTALITGIISLICSLAGPVAVFFGISALSEISRSGGKVGGKGMAIAGLALGGFASAILLVATPLVLIGLLLPAIGAAREAARRTVTNNNLRQIGLGVYNYHDSFKSIPLAGTPDPKHGVNMSWRVRLLPYIGQEAMRDQIDFRQSWENAPNNQFHDQMPATYRQPSQDAERRQTQYVVFTHEGQVKGAAPLTQGTVWFHPTKQREFAHCPDGVANTIMVVEADPDRAVPWMKPADLQLDPRNPKAGVGNHRRGGFAAVMGDGSVRFISNRISDEVMLKLILCNDGQRIHESEVAPPP